MKELTLHESQHIVGGLTGTETAILLAVAGYIVANWPDIKKGFSDGFLDGWTAAGA